MEIRRTLFHSTPEPVWIPEVQSVAAALRERVLAGADVGIYQSLSFSKSVAEYSLRCSDVLMRAAGIAEALRGVRAEGRPVLLLYPPGVDFLFAFAGCAYAGAIAIPAYLPDPRRLEMGLDRLRTVVQSSGAAHVLTTEPVLKMMADLNAGVVDGRAHWITTDALRAPSNSVPVADVRPDSPALIQYTSGSTGTPKGVIVTHRNLFAQVRLLVDSVGATSHDRIMVWSPFYHDLGLVLGVVTPALTGVPAVIMSPLDFLAAPSRWLRAISDHRVSISGGPNFAYALCCKRVTPALRETLDLSSWTVAFNGAEPVQAETLRRFAADFGPCGFAPSAFYVGWGMAETTLVATSSQREQAPRVITVSAASLEERRVLQLPSGAEDSREIVSCGFPQGDTTVCIVDTCSLEELPERRVGEIWVSGSGLSPGYWNNETATRDAYTERGGTRWLRTGDLGFADAGEIFFVGRLKDLIIVNGRNIHPQDVESCAQRAHASARSNSGAAFQIEAPDVNGVVLVQEIAHGASAMEIARAIRRAITQELNIALDDLVLIAPRGLPKTSSGKLQRQMCRALYQRKQFSSLLEANEGRGAMLALAEDSSERLWRFLKGWIAENLPARAQSVEQTSAASELGLDSLHAVELAAELSDGFGTDLEFGVWLSDMPIAEIVASFAGNQRTQALPVAARERTLLTFGQARMLHDIAHRPGYAQTLHVPFALHLRGRLDVDALSRAVDLTVDRHDALLETFALTAAGWECTPRSQRSALQRRSIVAERLPDVLAQLATSPFDLERGPLFRAELLQIEEDHHVFGWVAHHLVFDGWSASVLLREIAGAYVDLSAGREHAFRNAPVRFADFAAVQRARVHEARAEEQIAFWREHLAGVVPLNLALDAGAMRGAPFAPERRGFRLDSRTTAALSELGASQRATLFATLMAIYKISLWSWSGTRDVLVGAPLANRKHAATLRLVGYLSDTQLFRSQLEPERSLRHNISLVRQSVLRSFAGQDVPLPYLMQRLQNRTELDYQPIYQARFVMENFPLASIAIPGVELEQIRFGAPGGSTRDVSVYASSVGSELQLDLVFNRSLFSVRRIDQMTAELHRLLLAAPLHPDASLEALLSRAGRISV